MFDRIDRIMNLDIGNRGVEHLYEPARARNAEALCAAAARPLTALAAGECVILITGSLTRAWVSPKIGETDGPVGVAALARALSYGFNAIPVVDSDTSLTEPIGSLTVQVFTYAISPYEDWHRQAWAGAFVLVSVVLILSIIARLVIRRLERMNRGS